MSHPKNDGILDTHNINQPNGETREHSPSNDGTLGKRNFKGSEKESCYLPINSKSLTTSDRPTNMGSGVCSDFNITKNTLHVVGSNPGEPKKTYMDLPQKLSKERVKTKNLLHKIDKRKRDANMDRTISYATVRGILKTVRVPECTRDSSFRGDEEYDPTESLEYAIDYEPQGIKSADKNVSFDTHVRIFHFTGDLCVGQSVETLSRENDQQERNYVLRKTLMKYNEPWPKSDKRKK